MSFSVVLGALALSAALSLDSLLAGAGLGSGGVRITPGAALAAGAAGGGAIGLSLLAGRAALPFLPPWVARTAGFAILFGLGAFKLFEGTIKLLLRRAGGRRQLNFSCLGLGVLLDLYLVPQHADADRSCVLTTREGALLGIVLALDGLCAGLGAGLGGAPILLVPALCTLLGALGLRLGAGLGAALSGWLLGPDALAPVSGVLLMALAAFRLL